MFKKNKPDEWLKIISMKYRSSLDISNEKFFDLISTISNSIGIEIINREDDFVFPLRIENVNCMCAIVLINKNPITECQFIVMTNEGKRPSNLLGIEPIHNLIELLFLAK